MTDSPLGLLQRSIASYPEKVAIRFDTVEVSYRRLGELAELAAAQMRDAGVARGDRVGLLLGNSPDYLVADLALMLLGAVKVPLNPMLGSTEMAHILSHSGTTLLLTNDAFRASRIDQIVEQSSGSPSWAVHSLGEGLYLSDRAPSPFEPVIPGPDDDAVVYYTGGTTGLPKGVVHTHASVASNLIAHVIEAEIRREEVMLLSTPLSHAAGLFAASGLVRGATLDLRDGFSVSSVVDAVVDRAVTWTFMVPTMMYQVLDHARQSGTRLAGLDTIVYGASPITPGRLKEAVLGLDAGLIQLFGQTECPNWGTTLSKADHRRALDDATLFESAGSPSMLAEVRVTVDDRAAAPGEVGEVCLRAPYLMRGYLDNPDATAETLVSGWLRTGDIGLLDDRGYLYLKDRAKDMIISGGMNVYCGEVEAVMQQAPGVSQVAVIGLPHEKWGEAVAAFVVAEPGAILDLNAMDVFARESLAIYKRPKQITVVDTLPLTPFGKPDKKALRQRHWAGATRQIS